MMKKSQNLAVFAAVFAVVFLSLSLFVVFTYAQYVTEQTTDVTISSTGETHVDQTSTVGVSIDIAGTPGAKGTVSIATYLDNPQPDAAAPSNVTLTHFVVVTFNMAASDFQGANITIHYTDADVQGISAPYSLYKYIPESNSYILLPVVVDTVAKTLTATVTSTTDPLFAIGGATETNIISPDNSWLWAIAAVIVIVIVVFAFLVLRNRRKSLYLIS
jgi:hypothetical protein